MKVPEAKPTVGISTLSAPSASPDAFGAAVGRGMEAVGGQVARLGGMAMDAAVEMKRQKVIREAEDGYTNWLKQANDISNTEVFGKAGAQTDALLDDEENPENSGFRINYTSKLDKAFNDVSDKMSPNAKQRLGVMVQNQRLAYETRARNHVFTQQNEAAKYSAKVAVDVSQESAAQLARAYTKKQPDGAVNIQWPEVDRVMGDVVSAQAIYNARTGTPNEITLPDGTKKNVLAETARAGAHQKAIETLMAAGEFDEAQAYLNGLTAEIRPDGTANPYLNDFDGKQIKATSEAIRSGKEGQIRQVETAEVDRLQQDMIANPDEMFRKSGKELVSTYGRLPAAMQVSLLKGDLAAAERAAKTPPVMTGELIAGAFSDIASTEVTPENGILLARKLDRQGFKKETDAAVWNAFNEKFNPNFSSSIGENQPFYAIEKAKLTDALVKSNNGKWYKPKVYDYGEGDSGNPDKDKLSAFNAVLARETVLMDSFVKERLKKGTPYDQAVGEYWEQPRIKKMVDDRDIAALIDKTLIGKTSKDNEKSIDSGFSTLTNRTASVQSSLYVSDDDFNGITGLKF